LGGQSTEEEEMDDLFEDAVLSEINDVIAPVVESQPQTHSRNGAFSGNNAI
jgi:hypothetical protein